MILAPSFFETDRWPAGSVAQFPAVAATDSSKGMKIHPRVTLYDALPETPRRLCKRDDYPSLPRNHLCRAVQQ